MRRYQAPVVGMDFQGSAGSSGSPFCNSSMEMLSGERKKCHVPVARRHVDGNAGIHCFLANRVDVVDLVGQVPEITPTLVFLAIPVVGQLDQRRAFRPDLFQVFRRRQVDQRELALPRSRSDRFRPGRAGRDKTAWRLRGRALAPSCVGISSIISSA